MSQSIAESLSALPSIAYDDGGEERIIFALPPTKRPEQESVLAFSLHKSGNVMSTALVVRLGLCMGLTPVNIEGEFFQLGLRGWRETKEIPSSTSNIFLPKGYSYVGFPFFPAEYQIPIMRTAKSILLVRDPRDMLVSLYYSLLYSHPLPGKPLNTGYRTLPDRDVMSGMDVDAFVLAVHSHHAERMKKYRELCNLHPMLKVYRYEDVVYDKMSWVTDICAHFGWDVPKGKQREIVAMVDVFPGKEQQQSHVRQVHPGNFKKKLKPETIRKLDEIFAEEMEFFGYEPHSPSLWDRIRAWK